MKDRTQFWINLLVSTVLPLVLTGGGASLLVLFRDNLPHVLYVTVLWVLCLVIIAILLRLAFGDLINRLRTWIKQNLRHHARQKLVKEWYEKFRDLRELLREIIRTDWQPNKEQEDEYYKLHSWFIRNRSKFLPTWARFQASRTGAAHEQYGSSASLAHKVFYDNYKDPFSYFYKPLSIEELDEILKSHKYDVEDVLTKLLERMNEFIEWTSLK